MSARVAILMGGRSAERDVSLVSGAANRERARRTRPSTRSRSMSVPISRCGSAELRPHIDVAFNALHGRWGEDGCMQGLCALLDLPCTPFRVLASALAMDKPVARRLFAAAGVPVAEGKVATREALCAGDPLPRPFVVKPCNEGSSIDVAIVGEDDPPFAGRPWRWGESGARGGLCAGSRDHRRREGRPRPRRARNPPPRRVLRLQVEIHRGGGALPLPCAHARGGLRSGAGAR